MIAGRGFFQLETADDVGGGTAYTRAGNFFRNVEGDLVLGNTGGPCLIPNINIPDNAINIAVSSDGRFSWYVLGEKHRSEGGQLELARFVSPSGLKRIGGNLLIETKASGPAKTGSPQEQGHGEILHKFLEDSNVDPIQEYQRIQKYLAWLRVVRASIDAIDSGSEPKQVSRHISKPVQVEKKPERAVQVQDLVRLKVRNSAKLAKDGCAQYVDEAGHVTLVLHDPFATIPMTNNLAKVINGSLSPQGPGIARAINQKNVVVELPKSEQSEPIPFISRVLQTNVEPNMISTGARVVINERTGTIVFSQDVQIAPVTASHKGMMLGITGKGMTITVIPKEASLVERRCVVGLDPENRGGVKLSDLINAFDQLNVEVADRIAIVKEIHRGGQLHAQLIITEDAIALEDAGKCE